MSDYVIRDYDHQKSRRLALVSVLCVPYVYEDCRKRTASFCN